ncbi:uncharacterized protein LOC124930862 isoform X2 [Impatiens glandulifera]|uniref:uncharacterized protein LOC124930862 isoform X2 n=1 Tax=Impatiens glandulifera TaxID=253017 RepID=UPI001FB193D7|nr:uncharacterized protein LOC124930862 isoform X2 [Impatiens glandulifera]
MADSSSIDSILEFLRKNNFGSAEAAFRNELLNHTDLNGLLEKLNLKEKDVGEKSEQEKRNKTIVEKQGASSRSSGELSKELIVKEVDCGTDCRQKSIDVSVGEQAKQGQGDKNFGISKAYEDTVSSNQRPSATEVSDARKLNPTSREEKGSNDEKIKSWVGNTSKEVKTDSYVNQVSQTKELGQKQKISSVTFEDGFSFVDNPWSRSIEPTKNSFHMTKDNSIRTVFPSPDVEASTSYITDNVGDKREVKRKTEFTDIKAAIKAEVDEVGRALYFGKIAAEQNNATNLGFPLASEYPKEEFPRLPPVRLKSWEEKFDNDLQVSEISNSDNAFFIGSYLDVPVGQDLNFAGGKRGGGGGGSWLSVSQGIAEDNSDLVSGFATIGDGLSESVDYHNEYWDSDEYDDDDDVGYMRQPIEDETWFLAHEIESVRDPQERVPNKDEDDDQSFAEEDSYISGEHFHSKNVDTVTVPADPMDLSVTKLYGRTDESDLIAQYDGQLIDEVELNLMRSEPVWKGFVTQANELIMLGDENILSECGRNTLDDICMDDDQHGSVRSIGVGMNSDAADFGSVRESLVGGSSEGDLDYFHDNSVSRSRYSQQESDRKYLEKTNIGGKKTNKHDANKYVLEMDEDVGKQAKGQTDGGFSFPPPRDGKLEQSSKSLRSKKFEAVGNDDIDEPLNNQAEADETLASWRQKSTDSSPIRRSIDESTTNRVESADSTPSTISNFGHGEKDHVKKDTGEEDTNLREEDPGDLLDDEEAVAVQEQVKQIKMQEEEFETFDLKIVHRKNRTGFEEDKNFHVVLNSVIAGRYHVTEYLGSAAFSKAIQAHDLHTGMDVCVKIIKNNKDFFDQSLDEIKLLKFVNKHDPADKYHLLRLYDYFYYREHLLIVCELLKANLYEFHKFNRESGGEVYFTMPRLQSITIQCLEALQFLHGLGLIHCDLKPENILVKSYSRCEIKVIDLGSSCFETDHLCSYVQSRSYRAPEVILGVPYDKKIDIWSLGCILAELCTGNVLFQNDSPATLLSRVIGIIGSIDQEMLATGKDTSKFFTKNHMLYERNQESNRLEYLIPKKSSLRHRLPMGDQGFIDFVSHLLEINPKKRPSALEALKHPWLSYPYEPISS